MTPTNHKNIYLFCKIFGGISYPISCWIHCHLCNKAWGQQKSDLEQQMVKVWWEWDRKAKTEAKQRRAWVKNYRQEGLWRKSFLSHWLAPGTTKYAGTHWERVRFAPPCKLQLNFGSQTGVSSGERTMKGPLLWFPEEKLLMWPFFRDGPVLLIKFIWGLSWHSLFQDKA